MKHLDTFAGYRLIFISLIMEGITAFDNKFLGTKMYQLYHIRIGLQSKTRQSYKSKFITHRYLRYDNRYTGNADKILNVHSGRWHTVLLKKGLFVLKAMVQ